LGRWRGARCAATLEDFDDDHAAAATGAWRAMIRRDAGGQVRVVMLYRRIHRDRHRHGDQFSGARDVSFHPTLVDCRITVTGRWGTYVAQIELKKTPPKRGQEPPIMPPYC